jgi:antitoxin VapB
MTNDNAAAIHPSTQPHERRARRLQSALDRIRGLIDAVGVPAIVLTRPGAVAWATGGANPPIDRTASVDTVWLVVTPSSATLVTTEVEAPRIRAELIVTGVGLHAVPWWDADAFVGAAAEAADADPKQLGSDGHPAFGRDLDHQLTAARLPLSDAERDDLRDLGRDAAVAVEQALREWQPGEADRDIAGRVAASAERAGADTPCLLVGGDDRLRSFRHPIADGSHPQQVVMAVLVARRHGLHVALTRHAATTSDRALHHGLTRCRTIHCDTLRACAPGLTYGHALDTLATGYANAGAPGEWRAHYQGGPIGFGQREFEIAPTQLASRWWNQAISAGTAVAWNPSLPGGAKDEDTYLIAAPGLELVTTTNEWPMVDDDDLPRPAVLEVV